jgi:hypothetical protein
MEGDGITQNVVHVEVIHEAHDTLLVVQHRYQEAFDKISGSMGRDGLMEDDSNNVG